jgi:transitional endoplasmic reticulum ATPase
VEVVDLPLIQRALRKVQGSLGSAAREDDPTLNSLVLAPAMAETLMSLAKRMIDIEEVEQLGGSVPSGALFYGPPGTGKTYTARALARTAGWAFLPTTGQELLSKPERIDELLKKASDLRPCVVFIDEADDILGDRTTAPWAKAATNKLLTVIDGTGGKVKDVLFIAATNHPDAMDSAALRGGRFTEKVEFKLPDKATVVALVRDWMKTTRAPIAKGLTAEEIASAIGEASASDIREVLQSAVNHMIARHEPGMDVILIVRDVLKARQSVLGR